MRIASDALAVQLKDRIADLQSNLSSAITKTKKDEEEIGRMHGEIEVMTEEQEEYKGEISTLKTDLSAANEDVSVTERLLAATEQERDESRKLVSVLKADLSSAQTQTFMYQENIESLQRKMEELTFEKQVDKMSLSEQNTKVESLSAQLNVVTEEHNASQTLADQSADMLKETETRLGGSIDQGN
jgi:chromosome segregation ATPase